ncbi:hypothetical protein F5Y15DRAFT_424246 [Xylariaceae sp. FL0016]|nr:hypothetical protein F5Y15DRAFT_424246 [Xylariaceae sp. FL0016]
MARIPTVPGVEVTIRVRDFDTKAVSNHGCKLIQETQWGYLAKYIEADNDTNPVVIFKKQPGFRYHSHHIAYDIQFDDEDPLCLSHEHLEHHEAGKGRDTTWEDCTAAVIVRDDAGHWGERLFRFSRVKTMYAEFDAAPQVNDGNARGAHCGTIRVRVFHMKNAPIESADTYRYDPLMPSDRIDEHLVKGRDVSLGIKYDQVKESAAPNDEYEDKYADENGVKNGSPRPFAQFIFKYRSRDSLRRLGVTGINDLTRDELLEEMRALRSQNRIVKRKRNFDTVKVEQVDDDDYKVGNGSRLQARDSKHGLTAPPFAEPKYRRRRIDNEKTVIDLTEDD